MESYWVGESVEYLKVRVDGEWGKFLMEKVWKLCRWRWRWVGGDILVIF